MRLSRPLLLLTVLAPLVGACQYPTAPPPEQQTCTPPPGPPHAVEYDLVDLPDSALWYRGTPLQSFDDYPQDENGVVMFEYRAGRYYNPVQIAQRGQWFGENYRRTGDERYLERSEAHAQRLLMDAQEIDGALYLPYPFDFYLHGMSDQVMDATWYSGMAQGQALSLFLRLYELTGKEEYMAGAHGLMASFHRLHGEAENYVARIDCEGYYWIEEYPMEISTKTLNGFVFAMYGAYEYWRATGDEGAERLVKASLATLKHYLPTFRVDGEPSYYCLKHEVQYPRYHRIHIAQLMYLHRLSGDDYFDEMRDLYISDVPPE